MKVLLELAFSFAQIAVGAFGGGLSTLPLIGALSACQSDRMAYLVPVRTGLALSGDSGPIAINAATFVGFQQAASVNCFYFIDRYCTRFDFVCRIMCFEKIRGRKSRKFKDMLRPIVAACLHYRLFLHLQ